MKIGSRETELFHVDGQTEGPTEERAGMTKLTVTLLSFAKVPEK